MDFTNSFREIVNSAKSCDSGFDEETIIKKIKCLLGGTNNEHIWQSELRKIRSQFVLEFIIHGEEKEPYFGILTFLLDQFRDVRLIKPLFFQEEWREIVKLAREYFIINELNNINHIYSDINTSEQRTIAIAETIIFFRDRYQIEIPFENGLPQITDDTQKKIYSIIEYLIDKIGGLNMIPCLLYMSQPKYNKSLHRFLFAKNNNDILNTNPELPIGFLFNISVQYLISRNKIIKTNNQHDIGEFIELVKRYCALYNVESYSQWEDIIIKHENLPQKLQELIMFDSLYNINQFNPFHIRKLLNEIFSIVSNNDIGYDLSVYIKVMSDIIENYAKNPNFTIFNRKDIYNRYPNLLTTNINNILEYFSYDYDVVNKQYNSPYDFKSCNIANKPLIRLNRDNFLLIKSSMSAMSVYEAVMIDLRKKIKPIDNMIGTKLEDFVKSYLSEHKINYNYGKYKDKDGECDIVIESEKTIVFIEMKKKPLRRIAKSGNDIEIFKDISQSLIDSIIQLNRHEIELRENRKLKLEHYNIELKDREIEKLSLVMHDFGVLHDKPVFSAILRNLEYGNYDVYDPAKKEEFKKITKKFKVLNEQMQKIKTFDPKIAHDQYINCYFLCLDHLLTIIDDSVSNETFVENLLRIKYVTTYSHDFYILYNLAKSFK